MLPQAFARFDAEDIAGALLAQMDIYSRLLSEFDGYPYEAEYFARTQVHRLLGDGAE
jgi:hypothetical protein